MLYKASEVFRRAIDAIIHFGTEQHKSFFAPSEAADIKSVIQEYGETPEQHSAVGAWLFDYAESRQPFDKIKFRENKMQKSQCDNHLLLPNTLLTNLYALLSPVSGYVQSASFGIDMTMMAYL